MQGFNAMEYPFQITREELRANYMKVDNSAVYIHRNAENILAKNGFFKKSGAEFDACELNDLGLEVILSNCGSRILRLVISRPSGKNEYSWSEGGVVCECTDEKHGNYEWSFNKVKSA